MTEFMKDDFFKIDCEPHLIGDMERVNHFPGVQMWWRAIDNISRPLTSGMPPDAFEGLEEWEMAKTSDPSSLLRAMDKYGVDVACLLPESMMDTTGYTTRWCCNGEMAGIVESNPDRFMYQPNVSPIKHKGVKIRSGSSNTGSRRRAPGYSSFIRRKILVALLCKAEELGIVLDIHTGFCWVPPGKSKHALPLLIDDVARDFPDLKIVAFHMGYPYCDDLNMIAMGHPNVYPSLSC